MWDHNQPDLIPDEDQGKRESTVDPNDSKRESEKAVVAKDVSLIVPTKRVGCIVEDDLLPASRRLRISYYPSYPYRDEDNRKTQAKVSRIAGPSSYSNTPLDLGSSTCEGSDIEMASPSDITRREKITMREHNDTPRLPREAKGKGKMKVVPELPEEVWKRIFELYYDQCAEEWQTTGKMKNGVTPLLISPTLTNVATPVLYAHPHISDKQIDPFIKCVAFPFRCSDVPSKNTLVHHMTVRPTPIIPNYETGEYQYVRSSIVNSKFPYLMSLLPSLDSFTLKDTFMFTIEDVMSIIKGLEYIKPKKARIELRSWDLYDSPVGQDLLAATRPNLRASPSRNLGPSPPNSRSSSSTNAVPQISSWVRANGDETLRSWRDALQAGRQFFLPPVWLDPSSAAARAPNGAPLQANQAQLRIIQQALQARLTDLNPPPESTGTPLTLTMSGRYASQSHITGGLAAAAAGLGTVSPQNIDDDDQDDGASQGSALDHDDDDDDLDNDDDYVNDDRGPRGHSNMQTVSDRPASGGAGPVRDPIDPSSRHTYTSLATEAARALQRTDPDRYEQYIRSRRIDHIFIPSLDDSDTEAAGSSAPPVAGPSGSSEEQFVTDQAQAHYQSSALNMTGPDQRSTLFARQGRSDNYAVAHVMRIRLRLLITQNWAERLQAFSFVAFDPMASLVVRAPRLDFWVDLPIEHIRVHLPRGVNSLAVFKGPKENERDRIESIEKANQETPSSDAANNIVDNVFGPSSPAAQENRVVGGDGSGGGLVHPSNLLFEIEVNTTKEMMDDMWNRAGSELPPQVCRILAGEQDWSNVVAGRTKNSTPEKHPEDEYPSPKTEDYPSPTYSFASTVGGSDQHDDDDVEDLDMESQEPGEGYDAEAATRQMEMLAARKK